MNTILICIQKKIKREREENKENKNQPEYTFYKTKCKKKTKKYREKC